MLTPGPPARLRAPGGHGRPIGLAECRGRMGSGARGIFSRGRIGSQVLVLGAVPGATRSRSCVDAVSSVRRLEPRWGRTRVELESTRSVTWAPGRAPRRAAGG
eukprot:4350070-Pyramimonas_sp.AAC.1